MSYGITILNEDGHTQVDQNYRNFMMQNKGSVFCENDPYGHGYFEVGGSQTIGFAYAETNPPLVFVQPPVGTYANVQQTFYNSGAGVWGYVIKTGVEDTYVDWWSYNYPSPPAGGYGLEVLNASGEKIFNSLEPPLGS